MTRKKKLLLAALAIGLAVIVLPALRPIDAIYIRNGYYGIHSEYKVDLTAGKLWEFHRKMIDPNGSTMDWNNYTTRDPMAENEGFTTCTDLDPKKIPAFRRSCILHGLLFWRSSYDNGNMDAGSWYLTIRFADGSEKESWGVLMDPAPRNWETIRRDFQELTGWSLLEEKPLRY